MHTTAPPADAATAAASRPGTAASKHHEAIPFVYCTNADTVAAYQLQPEHANPMLARRLWHSVAARIQANKLPNRADAEVGVAVVCVVVMLVVVGMVVDDDDTHGRWATTGLCHGRR